MCLESAGSFGESDINYEGYVRSYRYDGAEEGETYILQSQVELEVERGDYDLTNPLSQDPAHLAALGRMAATLYRDIVTDYTAAGFSLDGNAWDLRNGPVGWAVGAETASEDYLDDYDAFREAGNILGSAGNSSAGDRTRWAVFGELSIPVAESVDLNAAGRYDDYDDFGNSFSPQISARWQVSDPSSCALRGERVSRRRTSPNSMYRAPSRSTMSRTSTAVKRLGSPRTIARRTRWKTSGAATLTSRPRLPSPSISGSCSNRRMACRFRLTGSR